MRLLISTGEVSGDLQGSFLVKALLNESEKRSLPLEVIALGGPRMQAAGAELLVNTSSIGAIGFLETLPFLIPTLRAQKTADNLFVNSPPDVLVLIDYMGPNIKLGNKVRKLFPDLPIVYYIAPQEWAWRIGEGGSTDLIGFTNKILAIFQKEADFYASKGGSVTWVGHPMLDNLRDLPTRNDACKKLKLDPSQKFLLVLPASRSQELKYILPTLLKAAAMLQEKDPSLYILLPAGQQSFESKLQRSLKKFGINGKVFPAKYTEDLKSSFFKVSELALTKSGTINMELALHSVPQIVGYKVSKLTALVAKKILQFEIDHISPVNLLLNERVVPELVQKDFTSEAIYNIASSLLNNKSVRSQILDGYNRLKSSLGEPGVTQRAAKEILDLLES
ncbi:MULTISPECIES: lipid-A-disaccharide synthase [unclassified Prochlorococcus]|uniref:lipid-A-disaccharide synthase n=1 Tax=unclassified Prochlorococcus TaxID=2627481 RepID=UPI000533A79B|nr:MULTISPECIES: lipid-A-disaccharide synthase [unclassified Prochlorococcus]KGG16224.1 Lipid-A-disaccharide synthase [Prochlorococcus sp. MIT 0603]KGG18042.1 Lipid-A-disaccharide synthase [Prochlorococcus sp. MIT 0602]